MLRKWIMRNGAHNFKIRLAYIMQFPEWTKPALIGVGVGAIGIAIIGFNWGGWVTGSTVVKMVDTASEVAVVSALTPYCIQMSQNDPASVVILAELESTSSYKRHRVIQDAGWATPLGFDEPSRPLADACETVLLSDI